MRIVKLLLLLVTFQGATTSALADEPANNAKSLFGNLQNLLVRVKAAESVTSPKSSYGTGFVIDPSGIIATNYHVISDYVMQPGSQWKIIVETRDNKNLEAELVDFTVVDDLALIRVKENFPSSIKLEDRTTSVGEKTYSLGLPDDINMSIVEGVYNGVLNYGPYSLVHVTTPINAGMSGGPTVNGSGRLVGSNVSKLVLENNVSFIVPVERMKLLVQGTNFKGKALSKKEAQEKIYSQLEKAQEKLVASLPKYKTQTVELWKGKSIELPEFLKCWAGGIDEPQLPFVLKKRTCNLDHNVFLAESLETGTFEVEVDILDASKINRFSVSQLMGQGSEIEEIISKFREKKFFGDIDAREIFTPYKCERSFLKTGFLGNPKTLRSGICIRKYSKAKNLYDLALNWYDFDGTLKTRVSITHSGVSLENSRKLLSYWTERFK